LKPRLAVSIVIAIVSVSGVFFYDYLSDKVDRQTLEGDPVPTSVAVLPFVNMSDDSDQQYFSDGITEELINMLARLPGLHVTARSSSFQLADSFEEMAVADVARQLGVASIVTGSVRRAEKTVRVTVALVNAANGFQM